MRLAPLLAVAACATPSAPAGDVARTLDAAATEAGVPGELLTAIAIEEGGITLPAWRLVGDDPIPSAGMLELRHGRLDTLALGARLVGASETALRANTELATRAGARVLAELGARPDDVATWRPALEALSGMADAEAADYARRVLAIVHDGREARGRGGELVRVGPHPEVDVPEAVARIVPASTPDYPGAIWLTTSCTNKCTPGRPLGNAAVDKIVIHDTEGGWDASVATLQFDSGKSVHYLVDADGSRVGQFRAETDTTWHAGNFYFNETSIGIEHVGVASDPKGFSAAQYARSRELVQNIRTRWTVPLDRTHIVGHYQIPDGNSIPERSTACTDTLDACETSPTYGGADHHRDPGYHWQWCQYMAALGGSCTCNDAYPRWNCTTDLTQAVRCKDGVVEIETCADGCEVMPVGVEDVCHGPVGPMTDAGTEPPAHGGGCTTGGSGGALFALALLLVRRRR